MTSIPVITVKLVREKSWPYGKTPNIKGATDVFNVLAALAEKDREWVCVLCLDAKNKVNCMHVVGIGSLNACIVHPREVLKAAILANAQKIILAHNHPSGDPTPSMDDHHVTEKLKEAGTIIGIELIDHVIIGDGQFYSFAESGAI